MSELALPDDLAPEQRSAVEALIAECGLAERPFRQKPSKYRREPCCFCGKRKGAMEPHHPDRTKMNEVVMAHPDCHKKHHRAQQHAENAARAAAGLPPFRHRP